MKQRELLLGSIVKDKETIKKYLAQLMRILAGTPPKGETK